MISLNYRDSRPIYEQIKDGLRKLIVTGAMAPDEKLPSVRALATQLSINPNTIQRAYNELEGEGYIYSVPGKGSFAAGNTGADESRRRELLEKLKPLLATVLLQHPLRRLESQSIRWLLTISNQPNLKEVA